MCSKVVGYCPGVFDNLHHGHINLINSALELCNELIIGIHSDEFVKNYKREPKQNENLRLLNLKNYYKNGNVKLVKIGGYHYDLIKKYNVKIIFHGTDWELESYKKQIGFYRDNLDELGIQIKLIPYTRGISTTNIINKKIPNIKNKQVFLFDLDNTLILGNKKKNFSDDLIKKLHNLKKDIYLITNNNNYSPNQIWDLLKSNEIHIWKENIITPMFSINEYLKVKNIKKIFIWGNKNSKDYFSKDYDLTNIESCELILIMYNSNFNHYELSELITGISKKQKKYIVSNIDLVYPDNQMILPDTGSILNMIINLTKIKPIEIFGKPNKIIPDNLLLKHKKQEIIFIGDSLTTDKILCENIGIDFIRIHEEYGTISNLGVLIDYLDFN